MQAGISVVRLQAVLCLLVLWAAVMVAPPSFAATQEVTIVYAGWGEAFEIDSRKAEVEAFYKAYPDSGIKVELDFAPWGGYHEKLLVRAAANAAPDIAIVSGAYLDGMVKQKMFMDLTPFITRDKFNLNNLPPGTPGRININGEYVGMPLEGVFPGGAELVYNADLVDEAGLRHPDFKFTWDNFLTYAQKMTKDTNGDGVSEVFGTTNIAKSPWEAVWGYRLRAYGGNLWNSDFTKSAINSPAAEGMLQFLKDLDDRWRVSGGVFDLGQAGMTIAWNGQAEQWANKLNFARVNTMPLGPSGYGLEPAAGRPIVWTIARGSKHPEAAWKFLQFLVSSPEAVKARPATGFGSTAWMPNARLWLDKVPSKLRPSYDVRLEYANWLQKNPPAPISKPLPTYDNYMAVITDFFTKFFQGSITASNALSNIQTKLDQLLVEAQSK